MAQGAQPPRKICVFSLPKRYTSSVARVCWCRLRALPVSHQRYSFPICITIIFLLWFAAVGAVFQGQDSNEELRSKAMTLLGRFIAVKVSASQSHSRGGGVRVAGGGDGGCGGGGVNVGVGVGFDGDGGGGGGGGGVGGGGSVGVVIFLLCCCGRCSCRCRWCCCCR